MREEDNYWKRAMRRRLTRRDMLRNAGIAGLGLAGATIIGCNTEQKAQPTAVATAKPVQTTVAGTTPAAAGTATATAVPKLAVPTGKVTIGTNQDLTQQVDPAMVIGGTSWPALLDMFDGLLVRDPATGKMVGGLAESWEAKPDKWVFKLNSKAKFWDGSPVTPEDVIWSIGRAIEKKQGYATELNSHFKGAEATGPLEVTVKTDPPYPEWLYRLELCPLVGSKKYYDKVGEAAFAKNPMGAGPFKLVKQEIGQYLEVEAFAEHYARVPNVKQIIARFIPEGSTRMSMLKTGQIDLMNDVPGPDIAAMKGDSTYTVVTNPRVHMYRMFFPEFLYPEPSPVKDLKVRQAMALALDRKAIVDKVLFGAGEIYENAFHPEMIGFNSKIQLRPYDPEKAKALLAEAGYANGFDIELGAEATDVYRDLTSAIAGYWKKVGINTKVTLEDNPTLFGRVRSKKQKYPWLQPASNAAYADAGIMIALYYLPEVGAYCYMNDQEIKDLYKESTKFMDPESRGQIFQKVDAIVTDKIYSLNIAAQHAVFALGPKVKEYRTHPGNGWMKEWYTIKLKA